MIASQERILQLCKEKGIAVSQLEKDCGFSNGYIATERKREFPANKLTKIASRLDTTIDYLMYGTNTKKIPATESDGQNEDFSTISNYDKRLLAWLHSLPREKMKAILISQDAPSDLL